MTSRRRPALILILALVGLTACSDDPMPRSQYEDALVAAFDAMEAGDTIPPDVHETICDGADDYRDKVNMPASIQSVVDNC